MVVGPWGGGGQVRLGKARPQAGEDLGEEVLVPRGVGRTPPLCHRTARGFGSDVSNARSRRYQSPSQLCHLANMQGCHRRPKATTDID